MEKKITTVRLKPEIQELLAQFQGNYQAEYKKRISQSETINIALDWYIKECYRLTKESDGK
jgi:hypothetical protein